MQEVKDHFFQDHNMPVSCGNVELRLFEPLTSCMPCLADSSDGVLLGRSRAGFLRRLPGSVRMIHPTHRARQAVRLGEGRQRRIPVRQRGRRLLFGAAGRREPNGHDDVGGAMGLHQRPSRRRRTAWRPDRGSLARTIHDQGGVLACNGGFAFVLSGGPPPVRWWRGAVQ